jgi:hypothetical protein
LEKNVKPTKQATLEDTQDLDETASPSEQDSVFHINPLMRALDGSFLPVIAILEAK